MNTKDRILDFIEFRGISKREFYLKTGLSNGFLDKVDNVGSDKLEKIISNYKDLSLTWLVTGSGDMIIEENQKVIAKQTRDIAKGIPLIPIEAMAGFGRGERSVSKSDIEEHYVIPMFKKVDFLIRIHGDSMLPKLSNGDVVACRYIENLLFIQWNNIYVLDTSSQGAVVKRLEDADDEHIKCVSDNVKYKPFIVPKMDIRSIALVVGAIVII